MSRPPIAIGHVTLRVADIGPAAEFYAVLGLRPIMQRASMAIFELRGGTHLLLFRAKGKAIGGFTAIEALASMTALSMSMRSNTAVIRRAD